jgi:Amt family ammonium transporter
MAMNDRVPMIIANTMLGGAAGLVATLFVGWNIRKRIDPDLVINGSLAGLVAITAGCFAISSSAAIIIGAVSGLVMLACDWLLERLQIDDAVGAIPVHLAAGIWGTIAVGIFGQPDLLGTGLSQMQQIAVQLEGVLICTVWTFGLAYSALFLVNKVVPLRVSLLQEQVGMNITEHSTSSELMDLLTVMDHQAHTGDLKQRAPVEPFTEVGQIAMHYNHVLEALDQAIARTRSIVQASQDAIITFSHDTQTIISLNPAAERMFGYQELELQGKHIKHLLYPDQQHSTSNIDDSLFDGEIHEFQTYRRNGNTLATELVLSRTSDQTALSILTLRDISERKRIELARSQLHEEIIKAQAATLAELSAPMIPLNKSALVMPLIGAMNTQRAQSIFETLLHGVERQGAKVVLLDVTGVQSMDTQVAHVLIQAAKAVRMLGARVVLTGISPEVARSLVGLSIDQRGITTYNTLQDAIAATL